MQYHTQTEHKTLVASRLNHSTQSRKNTTLEKARKITTAVHQ